MEDTTIEEVKVETPEINNRTVRFSDAPWYKSGIKIIIGGVGGIGSWLSLALSRQDSELYLFDFDQVDETNMGGQHFTTNDIGRNKAEVMKEQIANFSANTNVTTFENYDDDSFSNPIVFAAFDSMKARKLMFDKWVELMRSEEYEDKPGIFIDGRLLAEGIKVFAVTKDKIDEYRKFLWDDSEIQDLPCSFKATTHCSMIIGGLMVSIYNNYLTNLVYNCCVREVPFLTEFDLPTLTFNMKEDE